MKIGEVKIGDVLVWGRFRSEVRGGRGAPAKVLEIVRPPDRYGQSQPRKVRVELQADYDHGWGSTYPKGQVLTIGARELYGQWAEYDEQHRERREARADGSAAAEALATAVEAVTGQRVRTSIGHDGRHVSIQLSAGDALALAGALIAHATPAPTPALPA